jgi:hypothetical protein
MSESKMSLNVNDPLTPEKQVEDKQSELEKSPVLTKRVSMENVTQATASSISTVSEASESKELKADVSSEDVEHTDDEMNALNPKIELENIFSFEFPMNFVQFFETFISNDAKIPITEFHNFRNDRNIKLSKWTKDETLGFSRELSFVSDIKDAPLFSPKQAQVHRVQRYKIDSKKLVIDSETVTVDVPYGDSFRLIEKWEVTNVKVEEKEEPNRCKLEVQFGIIFSKSLFGMMKSVISSVSKKESVENSKKWTDFAIKSLDQSSSKHIQKEPSPRVDLQKDNEIPNLTQKAKKHHSTSHSDSRANLIIKKLKTVPFIYIILTLLFLLNFTLSFKVTELQSNLFHLNNVSQSNDKLLFSLILESKVPNASTDQKDVLGAYWMLRNDLQTLETAILNQKHSSKIISTETLREISRLAKLADLSLSKLYLEMTSSANENEIN